MKKLFCCIFGLVFTLVLLAQNYDEKIDLLLNNETGIYAKGDTIRVWAEIAPDCTEPLVFKIEKDQSAVLVEEEKNFPTGHSLLYEGVQTDPVSLIFSLGPKIKKHRPTQVGVLVSPEEFRPGYAAPNDLAAFWEKQMKTMRKSRMKASLNEVESGSKAIACYELEISMPEGAPARGYLALPREAATKSLPIIIKAHSAGVNKPWNKSMIHDAVKDAARGAIALDINAHGMKLGQPQAYYDSLSVGPLKEYSFRPIVDHQSFYFRLMYLRLVRAVDYLVTRREWDGQHILVYGTSQGGGQAGALAGIDHRITAAVMIVPALTDIGGKLDNGRRGGWPSQYARIAEEERSMSILPYYDVSLLLANSKASLYIEAGGIDRTCPPANVAAGFNNAASTDKSFYFFPYCPHGSKQIDPRHTSAYHQEVGAACGAFIKEHLK